MATSQNQNGIVDGVVIPKHSRRAEIVMNSDVQSTPLLPMAAAPKAHIRRDGWFGQNAQDLAHQNDLIQQTQEYEKGIHSLALLHRFLYEATLIGTTTAVALEDLYQHGLPNVPSGSAVEELARALIGDAFGQIRENSASGMAHMRNVLRPQPAKKPI